MDSITQALFGASVAAAAAPPGQRRKALLLGAALGTLPDLDVLIDYGDAVKNFTYHRGFSHSLFVLAPAAVLLWSVLRYFWPPAREAPYRWLAAIGLALLTHPLLDAHTAYGTQLFWPLDVPPVMWSTMFIIDPLLTLPLLLAVLYVAVRPKPTRASVALWGALGLSIAYVCWTWTAKIIVEDKAYRALAEKQIIGPRVFSTPTPFNSALWRVVVVSDDGYFEGLYSLVADEGPLSFEFYPADHSLFEEAQHVWAVRRLRWFAQGLVKAHVERDRLIVSDLRMGQDPVYVFSHVVAQRGNPHWRPIATELLPTSFEDRSLREVWERLWGRQSNDLP